MAAAPDLTVLVWRRKLAGDEMLQVADGKGWRLPLVSEIGVRHAVIDGEIGALVQVPADFDPGRMHRWVRVDVSDAAVAAAWRQAGAAVVVWRRGDGGPEILLLHQAVHGPEYEGDWAWSSPGGSLEPGETLEECAARELFEETGLDLPLTRVAVAGLPVALFTCEMRADHGIVLSDEHDRFEWVTLDDACARCRPEKIVIALDAARSHLS